MNLNLLATQGQWTKIWSDIKTGPFISAKDKSYILIQQFDISMILPYVYDTRKVPKLSSQGLQGSAFTSKSLLHATCKKIHQRNNHL